LLTAGNDKINASTHKLAIKWSAVKDDNISTIGWRTGTITTGATLDVRVETIDANGDPSGTLWDTNTNATKVVADTDDNVWLEVDLTSAASFSAGDQLAIVFTVSSGSPSGLNFISFYDDQSGYSDLAVSLQYNGSTWVEATSSLCIGALNGGGNPVDIVQQYWPCDAVGFTSYTSASTPDIIGNVFTMPFTARCCGAWSWNHHKDGELQLYSSDGTKIASSAVDVDDNPTNALFDERKLGWANQILTKGSTYRICSEPGAATLQYHNWITVDDAKWLPALPFSHIGDMHSTTAKTVGAWTDDNTKIFFITPLFNGIESGGAGFNSHIAIR
jgi:hypothetical protein